MKFNCRSMALVFAAYALAATQAVAQSQATNNWPQKPVKVVVAFPPGTPGDVLLRSLNSPLATALGQPVVIENKPGAGGNVGTASVINSPNDLHTIITSPDTLLTINPKIYNKLGFSPEQLVPVTTLGTVNLVLACHPSLKVKTVAELSALAKTRSLTYASGGPGVPGHLAIEMYLHMAGVDMMHVPYKGPAPATVDLMAGYVDCAFLVTNQIMPHVKSGKLVALAVSNKSRSLLAPDVPTMHEAGIQGFEATFAEMLWMPKGTPQAVIDHIQQEVAKLIKHPDIQATYRLVDVTPIGDTPAQAAQRIRAESARWAPVIKRIGLQVD